MGNLSKFLGVVLIVCMLGLLFVLGFVFFVVGLGAFLAFIIFKNIMVLWEGFRNSHSNKPAENQNSTTASVQIFDAEYTIIKDDKKIGDGNQN
jgi:hypothetical protein